MMKDKIDECILDLQKILLNLKDIKSEKVELSHSKSHVETSIKWLERLKNKTD